MNSSAALSKKALSRAAFFITFAFIGYSLAIPNADAQSTLTWTGANGAGWSNSPSSDANWTDNPGGAPTITNFANGDSVIFDSITDAANAGNRTIDVNAGGVSTNTMSVSGDGTYIFTGGSISSTGGISIGGTATLQIGNGGSIHANALDATVFVGSNAKLAFFTDSTNLNVGYDVGIGNVTGNGVVAFKGVSNTNQSSYRIDPSSSSFTGVMIVEDGARVVTIDSGPAISQGIVVQNGGGLYLLNESQAGNTYANTILIAGQGWTESSGHLGALRFDNGAEASGFVIMTADARIGALNATGTISGVVSDGTTGDGYQLEKASNGTVVLSGNNTYRGGTKVSEGTLRVVNAGGLGVGGAVDVASGANVEINLSQAYTLDHALTGTGNIKVNLGGNNAFALSANAGSAFAGTLALQHSTFNLADPNNAAAISNATLRLDTDSHVTVSGSVAVKGLSLGAGSVLTFNNGGNLALQTLGVDNGTGVTTINFTDFDNSTQLYTLITFENDASQFDTISFAVGTGVVDGYHLAFQGQNLVYTIVPEPSTYAMLAGALALALALAARRRRGK